MYFKDLEINSKDTLQAYLEEITEGETKSGSAYCTFVLWDGNEKIEAKLWNTEKKAVKVEEKTVITVQLYTKMYKETRSYEVFSYTKAPEGFEKSAFAKKTPYEPPLMYNDILKCIRAEVPKTIGKTDLIDLVERIYEKNKEKLLYWSAAKSVHHNLYGGLLYHTFRMIRSGIVLSRVYTNIDKEVLLAGIALHDIGKLKELETDEIGTADYTIDGTLFGHALLGIEMIQEEVSSFHATLQYQATVDSKYDEEKIKMLKHMLCSHHGNLDWGAITVPVIPEAMLLHEIDMIDSRMYQFEEEYKKIEAGTRGEKVFGLGTAVYKPSYK